MRIILKKFISLITVIGLIGGIAISQTTELLQKSVIIADAEETSTYTYNDNGIELEYKYLEDGTVEIIRFINSTTTDIVIPSTIDDKYVTSIGEYAFAYLDLLKVTFPDSIKIICSNAFSCTRIMSTVSLPDSLIAIEDRAFNRASLTNLIIPSSIKEIGEDVFSFCSLENITVDSNNTVFSSNNGVLFNYEQTELIRYPSKKLDTFYEVPDTVLNIRCCAFDNSKNLSKINIKNNVKSIGDMAFWGCIMLKNIELPDAVDSFGQAIFSGCELLESVILPKNIESFVIIDVSQHYDNAKGNENMFGGCSNLNSVTIPDSIKAIEPSAFIGCKNLTDIYYEGTEFQWNQIDFTSYTNLELKELKNATIHYNILQIDKTSIILKNGEQYQISANQSNLTYKSNNTDVAVVSKKGIVTAIGEGTATISVINSDADVVQLKVKVISANGISGDLNQDNIITISDAVVFQRYILGTQTFTYEQAKCADLTKDGIINIFDLSVLKYKLFS